MGNKFNFAEAREKAVRAADKELEQGMEKMSEGGFAVKPVQEPPTPPVKETAGEAEPTKGVQTYIPMSMYRRLNDIKLTRRENIAALVAQAIELWLDVQEGKRKVEKVI